MGRRVEPHWRGWSQQEIAIIRAHASRGFDAIVRELRGRTRNAVQIKARQEKIKVARKERLPSPRPRVYASHLKHAHPLVRKLYAAMAKEGLRQLDVAERAGVDHATMSRWVRRSSPTVVSLEACLNVVGYTLQAVPIAEEEDVDEEQLHGARERGRRATGERPAPAPRGGSRGPEAGEGGAAGALCAGGYQAAPADQGEA